MQEEQLKKFCEQKLKSAPVELDANAIEKLTAYLQLLHKWNQTYNLTSIDTPEEMVTHHLLDSLSIAPFIQGELILDVGTGAGLPGIPLAIAQPNFKFYLLDSNGKKIRFLTHVLHQLRLDNIELIQARVEEYQTYHCFNSIIARAFSSLADFVGQSKHLLCENGVWLAMKGIMPQDEIDEINDQYQIMATQLHIEGLDAERHLISIKNLA